MQLRATRLTAIASAVKRAFNIRSLFAGSVPGVWYDPSDYTTLFQDSAGTTPVTAVEQPVGLMLDKSQGLVLGSEKIVNGTFSSASNWTLNTNVVIANSRAEFTAAAASFLLFQDGGAQYYGSGRFYLVEFDYSSTVGLSVLLSGTGGLTAAAGAGRFRGYGFAANDTLGRFQINANGPNATGWVDNISVRELPGNHAFQATSASRPVLSARYNLLTKTEDLTDAVWSKLTGGTGSTPIITPGFPDPLGGNTAFRVQLNCGAGTGSGDYSVVRQTTSSSVTSRAIWAKSNTGANQSFQLANTSVANSPLVTATPTFAPLSVTTQPYVVFDIATSGDTGATRQIDIIVWHPSLLPANQSTLPYQRVNTSTDYNTTGFLPYLRFDGVDDSLSTNSISFTSTDKMSVFAGVRKLVDTFQMYCELSASISANNGTFLLYGGGTGTQQWISKGTVAVDVGSTPITAPITQVLTGVASISTDVATLRINGTQTVTSAADQGTGNYGNYPLFIGSRDNASQRFNGQMYSMIIVGKAVTAGELSSTEKFVASKTGVTL